MLRGRTKTGEGQRLGANYVLVERLGRGAMGDVWRAKERGGPERAIKVLRAELTEDPELVSRFVQERSVLKIRHPHLVPVHDLVVERETLAIVMELVRGHDLRKHLRQHGPLSPVEAVRLLTPVLDALAAVHQTGVVHRDIKPENVLLDLTTPATPKALLTDFGIARVTFGPSLTRLTGLIGTPEYMAPEMAEQTDADAAVDLYAFGAVLFEVIAGRSPFAGGPALAVLRRHVEQAPERPAEVPEALWPVIDALLSKDPAQRPSAVAAADWLRRIAPVLEGRLPAQPAPVDVEPLPFTPNDRLDTPVLPTYIGARHPSRQVEEPVEEPKSRWRSPYVLGPALTALLGLIAVAALVLPGEEPPLRVEPVAAVEQLMMAPVVYKDGLVVTRRWELSADKQRLRAVLGLHNSTGRPLTGRLTERLPEVFGASMLTATFRQKPTVLGKDAVAFYGFDGLQPGRFVPVEYVVPAPTEGDLADWAGQVVALRQQAGELAPRALSALALPKPEMSLAVGEDLRLPVKGVLDDASEASAPVLSGIAWSSSDAAVATVDQAGRVVAQGAGTTTIQTVVSGTKAASIEVVVVRQGQALPHEPLPDAPRAAPLRAQPAALLAPGAKPAPKPVVKKPAVVKKPEVKPVAPAPRPVRKQPVVVRKTAAARPAPVRTRARSNTGTTTQQRPTQPRPRPVDPQPEPAPVDPQPEAEPVDPQPE